MFSHTGAKVLKLSLGFRASGLGFNSVLGCEFDAKTAPPSTLTPKSSGGTSGSGARAFLGFRVSGLGFGLFGGGMLGCLGPLGYSGYLGVNEGYEPACRAAQLTAS